MKVVIVNRALGTLIGGGESFDLNAARYLEERGHEVVLVTGKPRWGAVKNFFPGLRVIYVPCPQLRHFAYMTERAHGKISACFYHLDNFFFEQAVYQWLARQKRDRVDIVQCCSLFRLPEKVVTRLRIPCVSWLPGPPSTLAQKRIVSLVRMPSFGLFTHGSSEWTLQGMGLRRGVDYVVVEPGVELSRIKALSCDRRATRSSLSLRDEDLVGGTVARLVPVKKHDLLFHGLARAKARGVIWHWIIIGGGPLENELRRRVEELGMADQVHFVGRQSQEQVHCWLNAVDLFALTSSYESFSIATLEAMAHGLPVIATDVGFLQHLVNSAGAGEVVSSNDPDGVADSLVRMVDVGLRAGYGSKGKDYVSCLDWPVIAGKVERLYQCVVNGTKK